MFLSPPVFLSQTALRTDVVSAGSSAPPHVPAHRPGHPVSMRHDQPLSIGRVVFGVIHVDPTVPAGDGGGASGSV